MDPPGMRVARTAVERIPLQSRSPRCHLVKQKHGYNAADSRHHLHVSKAEVLYDMSHKTSVASCTMFPRLKTCRRRKRPGHRARVLDILKYVVFAHVPLGVLRRMQA